MQPNRRRQGEYVRPKPVKLTEEKVELILKYVPDPNESMEATA